jgi:protocatechuate 3,4-dioxygenase alpha subunit
VNAGDPAQDCPADRRATLIATRKPGASALYKLDIRLQGHGETVFFDV